MIEKIARIYQELSDIRENAQEAATGAEALHDILIDLIDATRSLAVVTGEALEAKPAAETLPAPKAEPLDFWTQIEAIRIFANMERETVMEADFWREFSSEIDLHIFNTADNELRFECYAYPILNGETDASREIKIF